ncbi:hypothetical protein SAMN04487895_10350 [Paenibacillus sophorae]|uniref:Uncharacterized protein n=1 Tax=Paenibacillus sophorae TaxID=1333845 RepID=A0A1H8JK38_9BACL|nr:hypothetical protein SAMN04487895_10350 [Paenibacillus sophorae]
MKTSKALLYAIYLFLIVGSIVSLTTYHMSTLNVTISILTIAVSVLGIIRVAKDKYLK